MSWLFEAQILSFAVMLICYTFSFICPAFMPSLWVKVALTWFPFTEHLNGSRCWGLTGEAESSPTLDVSIRWRGKGCSPPSLTPLFPQSRASNCRAMNPPRFHLRSVGAQVRPLIWNPSKWYSPNISLEKQLSARERTKKRRLASLLSVASVVPGGQTLHWEGQSRIGVEPQLTPIFYQAFNLMNVFSLRVCHKHAASLILWWTML